MFSHFRAGKVRENVVSRTSGSWFKSCSGNCGFLRFPRRIRENEEKLLFWAENIPKNSSHKENRFPGPEIIAGFPQSLVKTRHLSETRVSPIFGQDTFRKLGFPQQNCEETSRLVLFQCQKHCRSLLLPVPHTGSKNIRRNRKLLMVGSNHRPIG